MSRGDLADLAAVKQKNFIGLDIRYKLYFKGGILSWTTLFN